MQAAATFHDAAGVSSLFSPYTYTHISKELLGVISSRKSHASFFGFRPRRPIASHRVVLPRNTAKGTSLRPGEFEPPRRGKSVRGQKQDGWDAGGDEEDTDIAAFSDGIPKEKTGRAERYRWL